MFLCIPWISFWFSKYSEDFIFSPKYDMALSLFLLAYTCRWFPRVGDILITQNHPYSCGLATHAIYLSMALFYAGVSCGYLDGISYLNWKVIGRFAYESFR